MKYLTSLNEAVDTVIGKTRSGKPIYQYAKTLAYMGEFQKKYSNYTALDHKDAEALHKELKDKEAIPSKQYPNDPDFSTTTTKGKKLSSGELLHKNEKNRKTTSFILDMMNKFKPDISNEQRINLDTNLKNKSVDFNELNNILGKDVVKKFDLLYKKYLSSIKDYFNIKKMDKLDRVSNIWWEHYFYGAEPDGWDTTWIYAANHEIDQLSN